MIKYKFNWLFLISMLCINMAKSQESKLNVFTMDRNALEINKAKIKNNDPKLLPSYEKLLNVADEVLAVKELYTVMEKKQIPPSGDMHDYMTIAIYFWPDPKKPDGLPYIRRDGEINPETKDYKDKANIGLMIKSVEKLALAYYFSDDEKYAEKAVSQIKAWFLDPATKMNPNLNYAQAIKGKNDGRGIGLIESREFVLVIDAIGLLQHSKHWTSKEQAGMEDWFKAYLEWFSTSKNGIEEMNAKNNHGIWYDAQKLGFALFTKNNKAAKATIESVKERLESQMDETGFFPLEMERTISLHYEAFILEPLFWIAQMGSFLNEDLWNYETPKGKSIKKGFEVLVPYLANEKEWFGQQIKPFEYDEYSSLLAKGHYKYQCSSCLTGIYKNLDNKADQSILHLTTLID
jgi:hypothetical protein